MVALPYMTRNTAAAVLTRIKTEVFGLEEGSSLGAAFERAGIVNVHDLLALSHEQIDLLNYFPRAETGSTARPVAVPINIGNRNLIRLFQSWIRQKCQVSKSVGVTLENTGRMDCGSLCDTIQSTIR